MKKIFLILFILLNGCSLKPDFLIPENLNNQPYNLVPKPPITKIQVKDFISLPGFNNFPDKIINLNLIQSATLEEFFQILIDQKINIVLDLKEKSEEIINIPNYSGSLKKLLKSIQLTHGLFFTYEDNILICKVVSPVYIKVLMPDMQKQLIKLLNSFNVTDVFYDSLSSRIVFNTDYFTYKSILNYFKNNNYLSIVFFDVMILEKEKNHVLEHGFDWESLSVNLQRLSKIPFSLHLSGSSHGSYSVSFGNNNFSLSSIVNSIDSLKSFEILQSARISACNGFAAKLDVSNKIPYVKSINISSVGDTSKTVTTYDFGSVSSGLLLELKPQVTDSLISLFFNCEIQSVNEFLEVGTVNQQVKQPVVLTRNFSNQIIIVPGEAVLIGGLKYQKGGINKQSLSFLKKIGLQRNEVKTFFVSVVIKSEVIQYEFI